MVLTIADHLEKVIFSIKKILSWEEPVNCFWKYKNCKFYFSINKLFFWVMYVRTQNTFKSEFYCSNTVAGANNTHICDDQCINREC